MSPRLLSSCAILGCLVGCAVAPPRVARDAGSPPATVDAREAIVRASPAPVAAPLEPPPPLDGPLPESSASIRRLSTPPATTFVFVAGDATAGTILALSDQNELFVVQRDGVVSKGRPSCPEPYWNGDSIEPVFRWATRVGQHFELRGSISRVGRAEWRQGMVASNESGVWKCTLDVERSVDQADISGGTGWYGAGPMELDLQHLTLGRPFRSRWGFSSGAWTASRDDSLWMLFSGTGLRHFNGTIWEPFASPPMREVSTLLEDADDVLWVLGDVGEQAAPIRALARMRDGAWSFVATPRGFDATAMGAPRSPASRAQAWFFGSSWWQWEGGALHAAPGTFAVRAAWPSPTGSLWVAGEGLAEITGAER